MATRRALSSPSTTEAERSISGVFERPSSSEEEARATGRAGRYATNYSTDGVEIIELQNSIARIPTEPQNPVQERYDALTIERYQQELCRAEELRLMLRARMAMCGVAYEQYAACIEHPERVRGDKPLVGERSFRAMAEDYARLRKQSVEEKAAYQAACKRRGINLGKEPKQAERLSPLVECQHELGVVYESIIAKRGQVSFEEAVSLHELTVQALRKTKLPSSESQIPLSERHALATIRYFHQHIESRLDQVRTHELHPVRRVAEEARLALAAGRDAESAQKQQELRVLLTRLAPLYLLDPASESTRILETRAEYHMTFAWLKELKHWLHEGRVTNSEAVRAQVDQLRPQIERLRQEGYPSGPCMSSTSIEAYRQAG